VDSNLVGKMDEDSKYPKIKRAQGKRACHFVVGLFIMPIFLTN